MRLAMPLHLTALAIGQAWEQAAWSSFSSCSRAQSRALSPLEGSKGGLPSSSGGDSESSSGQLSTWRHEGVWQKKRTPQHRSYKDVVQAICSYLCYKQ